jgi:hypothetical protein
MFENRVLKKIFGPKKDEVKREWRKLHNEELYCLFYSNKYYSGNKIKNEMGRAYGTHRGQERCIQGV